MPFIELSKSPHARGVRPVNIHYRDLGTGQPVVFLHGGWGYCIYPIDHQIKAFQSHVRFIIPDRSGYGRSGRFRGPMPIDFHQRAADETLLILTALGIERAIFWGHSDGAVIAAKLGLSAPHRCVRLILEAIPNLKNSTRAASSNDLPRIPTKTKKAGKSYSRSIMAKRIGETWCSGIAACGSNWRRKARNPTKICSTVNWPS